MEHPLAIQTSPLKRVKRYYKDMDHSHTMDPHAALPMDVLSMAQIECISQYKKIQREKIDLMS